MEKIRELNCILLVDDDVPTNYLHRKVISDANLGVKIQITESGEEALAFLTCTGRYAGTDRYPQPGIIFLDINMPGMNGWEFMEAYEKLPDCQKAKIVVVMLTSSINPNDKKQSGVNKDIKSFCIKPLTRTMLTRIIEENFEESPVA